MNEERSVSSALLGTLALGIVLIAGNIAFHRLGEIPLLSGVIELGSVYLFLSALVLGFVLLAGERRVLTIKSSVLLAILASLGYGAFTAAVGFHHGPVPGQFSLVAHWRGVLTLAAGGLAMAAMLVVGMGFGARSILGLISGIGLVVLSLVVWGALLEIYRSSLLTAGFQMARGFVLAMVMGVPLSAIGYSHSGRSAKK
ncbi:hypothetical protein IL252_03815 [Halomicrobium sp. IBSBa]|uniref:hypothetical protein n=1 Tax=Halomicrobium sp. IBSBa TaxID=2778916 RepID=UPI001ABF092D|nr:hypothetical protein [Halomicrobium sp. IBSBa]MBO4246947.1 hypothetical protein [Halomicrobium sp. IBSBa]